MPVFAPDVWNQPDVVQLNNCYNYALDRLNTPQAGAATPEPAEPGAGHDISAAQVVAAEPNGDGYTLYSDYTATGIKTAALADGLHERDEHSTCGAAHWRVAYFVRHFIEGPPAISGTPHFVREDRPGHWSHKPGSRPVTQCQYDPATRAYSGPPITAPSTDRVGPGLDFGGYLCCGPDLALGSLPQPRTPDAAVVANTENEIMRGALAVAGMADVSRLVASRTQWSAGFGAGNLIYRVDTVESHDAPAQSIFVTDQSITMWDGSPSSTPDADGRVLAFLRDRFNAA
jgi:hypothetical protein